MDGSGIFWNIPPVFSKQKQHDGLRERERKAKTLICHRKESDLGLPSWFCRRSHSPPMSFDDDLAAAIAASLADVKRTVKPAESVFPHLLARRATVSWSSVPVSRVVALPLGDAANAHVPELVGEVELHPAPITRSLPRSMAVRMTIGSFTAYSARSLLHCGVSNSRGVVYNFDERGRHADDSWLECVCVPLPVDLPDAEFDAALVAHNAAHARANVKYHPLQHNCFDYLVGFLNAVRYGGTAGNSKATVEEALETPLIRVIQYMEAAKHLSRPAGAVYFAAEAVNPALHGHELTCFNDESLRHCCNVCSVRAAGHRWTCAVCDFDVCVDCFNKHAPAPMATAPSLAPPSEAEGNVSVPSTEQAAAAAAVDDALPSPPDVGKE